MNNIDVVLDSMKFLFIDYSSYYYTSVLRVAVPPVRGGKFVLLRNGNTEYLILAPKDLSGYHADIVDRFCKQYDIAGVYDRGAKHFEIFDRNWNVAGGGMWRIDDKNKELNLYGASQAYGRFDEKGLLENILNVGALSGYNIKIS